MYTLEINCVVIRILQRSEDSKIGVDSKHIIKYLLTFLKVFTRGLNDAVIHIWNSTMTTLVQMKTSYNVGIIERGIGFYQQFLFHLLIN